MNIILVNRFLLLFVSILVVTGLNSCFHRLAPASKTEAQYDAKANSTTYTVLPHGNVILPGKWEAGKYAKTSRQQYFYRADTTTMIVSVGLCSSYEFGKGKVADADFINSYYNMEANYQIKLQEQTPVILESDSAARYKIWMVRADGIDQYYLCGTKDCACKECSYRTLILKNRKINQADAIALLKQVFASGK